MDVQHEWVSGARAVHRAQDLVDRLAAAMAAARDAGAVVIQLQDVGSDDSMVAPGTAGRELVLPVGADEVVLSKTLDDGFVGTGLEEALRTAGVESLVIGGLNSELCVAATARGAMARGFTVVLPRDGHATHHIPADGGVPAVAAPQVSRVAEWSLGDEVVVVDHLADVRFARPDR